MDPHAPTRSKWWFYGISIGIEWVNNGIYLEELPGLVDIQKTMDKHLLMDKSTISTGPFSIAMLLYQRVSLNPKPSPTLRFMTVGISLAMRCKIDTQLVYAQCTAILIQIEMLQNHGNLALFPLTWNRIKVESGDLDSKHHGTLLFTLK